MPSKALDFKCSPIQLNLRTFFRESHLHGPTHKYFTLGPGSPGSPGGPCENQTKIKPQVITAAVREMQK